MNQYQTERRLSWCYSLLVVNLAISVISIAITYFHWNSTLDVCPSTWLENNSCGCIFFGISTFSYFNGGHNSYCNYAIISLIPILLYAVVLAIFHIYRVCVNNVGQFEDEKSVAMEEIEGETIVVTSRSRVSQNRDSIVYCWIPTSSIAVGICIYNLVHAIIITNGYWKTCKQYRGYLVKELRATGDHASVIHFRLSCQAIYDFMDYLQKDSRNSFRGSFINTGLFLQIAIITSWISVCLWLAVFVYTAFKAYRDRNVLSCCTT